MFTNCFGVICIFWFVPCVGWVELFKILGSVLTCTEFCLFRRGKDVFKLGNVGKVILMGLNFVLIQLNSQVVVLMSLVNICIFCAISSRIIILIIIFKVN